MLTAAGLVLISPYAQAARPLTLGFFDPVFVGPAPDRTRWLDATRDAGGGIVRIGVTWALVAPTRPADARDPGSPEYRWLAVDAAVRDASARGLRVLLTLSGAPRWAEGGGRPASAVPGTWKPDPAAYEAFASAAARRYSGRFTPAGAPGPLPRVDAWQAWNEPNLDEHLAPQWSGRGAGAKPVSPTSYRALLNAMFAAVKAVDPRALVVSAGTAPYGDPRPGGHRISPVRFVRELLCLDARLRRRCSATTRFDVLSHHPYGVRGPTSRALADDDVAVADLGKLTRVLRAAERRRTALPVERHRLWVTEISWDSRPPDPQGVPAARHARWLEQALYVLWKAGVDTVTWFRIVDQAPQPDFASTNQSGIYLRSGAAKPAATAFRFPFVGERLRSGRTRAWGLAPHPGLVQIERRARGGWRVVATLRAGRNRVFAHGVRTRSPSTLRARQGDATSLSWTQR